MSQYKQIKKVFTKRLQEQNNCVSTSAIFKYVIYFVPYTFKTKYIFWFIGNKEQQNCGNTRCVKSLEA